MIHQIETPVYTLGSRPSFDDYFLFLAFAVALRSDDLFVKHGAVLVSDKSKHIIGTGYNGSIRKMSDEILQPTDRNARRGLMIHAEANCLANTTQNPLDVAYQTTIYVTGEPCLNCLQSIINHGVTRIVCADRNGSLAESEETKLLKQQIIDLYRDQNIQVVTIPKTNIWVEKGLALLSTN